MFQKGEDFYHLNLLHSCILNLLISDPNISFDKRQIVHILLYPIRFIDSCLLFHFTKKPSMILLSLMYASYSVFIFRQDSQDLSPKYGLIVKHWSHLAEFAGVLCSF